MQHDAISRDLEQRNRALVDEFKRRYPAADDFGPKRPATPKEETTDHHELPQITDQLQKQTQAIQGLEQNLFALVTRVQEQDRLQSQSRSPHAAITYPSGCSDRGHGGTNGECSFINIELGKLWKREFRAHNEVSIAQLHDALDKFIRLEAPKEKINLKGALLVIDRDQNGRLSHIELNNSFSTDMALLDAVRAMATQAAVEPPDHEAMRASVSLPSASFGFKRARMTDEEYGQLRVQQKCEVWVTSAKFETFFGMLIIVNTVLMVFQFQYQGIETGHSIGFARYDRSAEQSWPGAKEAFYGLEIFFGASFSFELAAKIFGFGFSRKFFCSFWNMFDAFIVACWAIDFGNLLETGVNPMMLRLTRVSRLSRLLRIFRLARWMHIFGPLHLLMGAIGASVYVLFWSVVLLFVIMMALAMLLNQMLEGWILDVNNNSDDRAAVFSYFGTFTRALITMFEITLANWAPSCRLLTNKVSEWYGVFYVFYKVTAGFAVMKVITGVFLHETFKVAHSDDEMMVIEKERQQMQYVDKLRALFAKADQSGDHCITWDEFQTVLSEKDARIYLAAMEVDVVDLDHLFQLLDDGDGSMNFDEFALGVKQMKGAAKAQDMMHLKKAFARFERKLETCLARPASGPTPRPPGAVLHFAPCKNGGPMSCQ